MNLDPVFPPINGTGVIAKISFLSRFQRMREFFNVVRHEVVFVMQNEGFEELNELLQFLQAAFGTGQRWTFQWQRRHDVLD